MRTPNAGWLILFDRCPKMARNGPAGLVWRSPLFGVDRKSPAECKTDVIDPEQKSATSKVSSVDRSLKVSGRHRVAVIVATVLERVRRPARLASAKGS